jgi:hypothetical protein
MEIRRIEEDEGAAVAALWDALGRSVPDGAALRPAWRERIARMLSATAWHREAFTLVAIEAGTVVGFRLARVDAGDGLMPEAVGRLEEAWPLEGPAAEALVAAAVAELRSRGVVAIRVDADVDDPAQQAVWRARGWEPEQVTWATYPG